MDVLFKVESQHGYQIALGPTHEEIVTPMALPIISSYRDLPLAVYQIQTKFRDEPRAKSGLLRGREFRMKDLYSFHADEADLDRYYEIAAEAYRKIFSRLSLEALYTEASGGTFTKFSHEFQVPIETGEDTIYVCTNCKLAKNKEIYEDGAVCTSCAKSDYQEQKASEVGNIFKLMTKFSEAFNLNYTADDGSKKPVIMGCYGIGPSRIMGVLVERFHDDKGIIWPKAVAPFDAHLIVILGKGGNSVQEQAEKLYADLRSQGIEVLYDDREGKTAGEKFADSDLIGIPTRIIISEKTLAEDSAEVKDRSSDKAGMVKLHELAQHLK
jgi:prolyl-tRNA synthetase